jgi:uncharacterized protein (UPF0276 family)
LIEWDNNVPAFAALAGEMDRARSLMTAQNLTVQSHAARRAA